MTRIPPPVLALAAIAVQRSLTRRAQPPTVARAASAAATTLGSVVLAGASVRQLRRSGTSLDPSDPARASVLVTTGVNTITRNPMYLGLTGLLISHAIWRGSWRGLGPAVGFMVVIERWQIAAEESALLVNFGAAFEAYRTRVPRWLGLRSLPHESSWSPRKG